MCVIQLRNARLLYSKHYIGLSKEGWKLPYCFRNLHVFEKKLPILLHVEKSDKRF